MHNLKDINEGVIFPKGQKITDEHFIGTTWVEALVPMDRTFNCHVANVAFEPGARNNWHKHPGGQILLVTGGIGYYQEEMISLIRSAIERGVTFFDTAEAYGPFTKCDINSALSKINIAGDRYPEELEKRTGR